MKTIATTLFHRVLMPEGPPAGPHPLLVLIHGRGADEEDLLGLVPAFDPRLIVLSVRAPLPWEGGGYTWYALGGPVGQPEHGSFTASFRALDRCIRDAVGGYPVDPSRVFLFGFSMGAVMSIAMALTAPKMFRGVVAHSGYVPEGVPLPFRLGDPELPPIFLAHGTLDQVIPIAMARHARELLDGPHARLTYREYPIGHGISDDGAADVREWMHGLLGQEPAAGHP
jgi:phospholipase/carboxylesterase